jgi:hypothetical protein
VDFNLVDFKGLTMLASVATRIRDAPNRLQIFAGGEDNPENTAWEGFQ